MNGDLTYITGTPGQRTTWRIEHPHESGAWYAYLTDAAPVGVEQPKVIANRWKLEDLLKALDEYKFEPKSQMTTKVMGHTLGLEHREKR